MRPHGVRRAAAAHCAFCQAYFCDMPGKDGMCRHRCWASHVQGLVLCPEAPRAMRSFVCCLSPTSPLSLPRRREGQASDEAKGGGEGLLGGGQGVSGEEEGRGEGDQGGGCKGVCVLCVCVKGKRVHTHTSSPSYLRLSTFFSHRPPTPQIGKKK